MSEIKTRLLEAYEQMYEDNPKEYKGACKINKQIGLSEKDYGHNYYGIHKHLKELEKEGYLEQEYGSGFRLYKINKKTRFMTRV